MTEHGKQEGAVDRTPVIMIVDDEEMVTVSLSSLLELDTDYIVLAYQSPGEALKTLNERTVDMVISDFLMPRMNGLEFFAEVKKICPDIPLVLLTGYADKENAIRAINEIGIFQFIEKPWDNEHLKLVIKNGLQSWNLQRMLKSKIRELDEALRQREKLMRTTGALKQELDLARNIQQQLFPREFPSEDGLLISARTIPAIEIGGDYYDAIPLADNHLGVLIADISGHGIQAALGTALVKFAFSSFNGGVPDATQILTGMNAILGRGLPRDIYVAAMLAIIDREQGICRLTNGGIPHPYLIRRDTKAVEQLPANGLLLGMADGSLFEPGDQISIDLGKGDCLILFTDGITEAVSDSGEFFEDGRLADTLRRAAHLSGKEIVDTLTESVMQFRHKDRNPDDITVLGIEQRLKRR